MIERLGDEKVVQSAAVIAYTFHMDPVDVISGDYFSYAVRAAAKNYVAKRLEQERNKKKK